MRTDERRAKKILFVRVGLLAVASALSAAALIKIRLLLIDTRSTQRELESRESKIADLKRSNDELMTLSNVRTQHHAAALKNMDYVTRFYQLCREPIDLPPLKTDFIVSENYANNIKQGDFFAFSVPSGNHTLQLSIAKFEGGMQRTMPVTSPETFKFPLIPSAGYFVRIYYAVEEQSGQLRVFVELTSNDAAFNSVRRALPISISKPFDNPLDEPSPFFVSLRKLEDMSGDFKNLNYPNNCSLTGLRSSGLEKGVELGTCHLLSLDMLPMTIRFSIISDTQPCVTSSSLRFSGVTSDRLAPYTGNGRIYVRQ